MAFIRLGAALLGWFFGFFLGASLLEVIGAPTLRDALMRSGIADP